MRGLPLVAAVRFVIYSSPSTNQVFYWRAPTGPWGDDDAATATPTAVATGVNAGVAEKLIEDDGTLPVGVAVDHARNGLYVACPGTAEIRRYMLVEAAGGTLLAESPVVVVANVKARWVAVDAVGTLFYTDEDNSRIYRVQAKELIDPTSTTVSFLKGSNPGTYKTTTVDQPEAIYQQQSVSALSSPGGIAVDNFRVFWTNKVFGTQAGSVVQGLEHPTAADPNKVLTISANANKVYGVCLSANNVYYTNEADYLYGVKKFGGAIATISEKLIAPRGCAWDGDGTVYVADNGHAADGTGSKIWSFPANMKSLSPQKLEVAYDTTQTSSPPFGIAVFSTSSLAAVAALLGFAL